MDVHDSLEMAKSDKDRASGHANDKSQAHDCAVCYGHMMHMGQKRDKSVISFSCLCARVLGACNGDCRPVSNPHFTFQEERRLY